MLSIMCLLSFISNRLPPPKGHQVLTVYTNIVILLVLSPCSQVGRVGRDLDSRRHKPSDLQSDPIDHSGTYPICYFILKESQAGFKPTIKNFADSWLNHLPTGTFVIICVAAWKSSNNYQAFWFMGRKSYLLPPLNSLNAPIAFW